MKEVIALIDRLIEEHRTIGQRMKKLEKVVNDAEALAGLEKAKEAFMPGRFEQLQGLKELQELVQTTEEGLLAHFDREETALLSAVEKYGGKEIASALHTLLNEHKDLVNRMAQAKKQVEELMIQGLARHSWEAKAHDMRAYISHTRKLIEKHASNEQELFYKLRTELTKQQKE